MRRLVILTGTATFNKLIGEASGYASAVRSALERDGFDVIGVKINKPMLFSNTVNVTIECNVDVAYSAEQARVNATNVISGIGVQASGVADVLPLNILTQFAGGGLFSNVSLRILSDGAPATTNTDTTLNDALSNIVSFGGGLVKSAVDNTTKNAMTPVSMALVAGVGLVLLTLVYAPRRR